MNVTDPDFLQQVQEKLKKENQRMETSFPDAFLLCNYQYRKQCLRYLKQAQYRPGVITVKGRIIIGGSPKIGAPT